MTGSLPQVKFANLDYLNRSRIIQACSAFKDLERNDRELFQKDSFIGADIFVQGIVASQVINSPEPWTQENFSPFLRVHGFDDLSEEKLKLVSDSSHAGMSIGGILQLVAGLRYPNG